MSSWAGPSRLLSIEIADLIRTALSSGVAILLGAAHWNSSQLSIQLAILHEMREIVK
jgi:hypothetical protein